MWIVAVALYVLAGATIGRMAYEFDVFSARPSIDPVQARHRHRVEVASTVITGLIWPLVPMWALWVHMRTPRRTSRR